MEKAKERIATQIKTYSQYAKDCFKTAGPGSVEGLYWANIVRGLTEALEIMKEED